MVNDPLGHGFIASLARPGGNITGFTFVDFPLIGKWLEMLKEIAPGVRRMTLMLDPQTAPYYPIFLREFGAAASLAGEISATPVRDEAEIEVGVTALGARSRPTFRFGARQKRINPDRGHCGNLTKLWILPLIGVAANAPS